MRNVQGIPTTARTYRSMLSGQPHTPLNPPGPRNFHGAWSAPWSPVQNGTEKQVTFFHLKSKHGWRRAEGGGGARLNSWIRDVLSSKPNSVVSRGLLKWCCFILTQFIWNYFQNFRTGPRTTPMATVSDTDSRLVLGPLLLLVIQTPDWS